MTAWIKINDITFFAYHGVLPEEQRLGQEFRVSLELQLDLPSRVSDLLSETTDYRRAIEIVRQIMEGPPRRLLEKLAGDIAAGLLDLPGIRAVRISVSKPHPPIPAVQGGVSVEISRERES